MIIDFHTHTYPNEIAQKVINRLAKASDLYAYTSGTTQGLITSQTSAGIDLSILLPVVTKPSQTEDINRIAMQINAHSKDLHLYSFAGIHPEETDIKKVISDISSNGFKGIKLHPHFQGKAIDDECYLKIIDLAVDFELLVLIHGGSDINFPDSSFASPEKTAHVLDVLGNPPGIILAHMGGWHDWDKALELLSGRDIFLDTSSCLTPLLNFDKQKVPGKFREPISISLFKSFVDCFGANHILFGSDSPWGGQKESIEALRATGLSKDKLDLILGDNAARLLGITYDN